MTSDKFQSTLFNVSHITLTIRKKKVHTPMLTDSIHPQVINQSKKPTQLYPYAHTSAFPQHNKPLRRCSRTQRTNLLTSPHNTKGFQTGISRAPKDQTRHQTNYSRFRTETPLPPFASPHLVPAKYTYSTSPLTKVRSSLFFFPNCGNAIPCLVMSVLQSPSWGSMGIRQGREKRTEGVSLANGVYFIGW
jgi:hypothetical protein